MVNVSKMLYGKWLPNILSYEVPSFNCAIFGHDFQVFFSGLEREFARWKGVQFWNLDTNLFSRKVPWISISLVTA